MATAVTIQIKVDSAQAASAISAVTNGLKQGAIEAEVAVKRASEKINGHMASNLDAVRLLSQEFGLRLPRALESMLSRMPALTSALNGFLGGLAGIAATEVFVHLGEEGYKLYQQYISLNAEADKFYETLKKTAQEDFSQTRSIETTRRRANSSTQSSADAPAIAQMLQRSGISEMLQGNVLGGFAALRGGNQTASMGVEAAGNMVKLGKVQLDQTHEQALAQINLNHAMDGALVGQQKINAEIAKKKQIDAEDRSFNRKTEQFYGNPAAADAGATEQRMKDQQAEAEGKAQSIVLGRATSLALMKAHDEMVQSNLQGDDLYLRKFEDIGREMTLAMSNEGKSQQEIHAAVLAAQSKLDEEYAAKWLDKWRSTQEAAASARVVGLTGGARVVGDFENRLNTINSDRSLDPEQASQLRIAAKTEETQKLAELDDNYQRNAIADLEARTAAEMGAIEKIDAATKKALYARRDAYDRVYKGTPLDTDQNRSGLAASLGAISAEGQRQKNQVTQANNATDLQYAQEAERAEARVREDGFTGWIAQYKNTATEIEDLQREHLAKMQEQAQKDGATQPEIEARKQAIVRESNAQIEQLNQQMKDKIAGTLQEAFTNPVDFIKNAMEKMFFEIVAGWVMHMQLFKTLFGNTMGGLQPGGGAGGASGIAGALGGALGIGGGAAASTGASGAIAAASGAASTTSGVGAIGGSISSVTGLAQTLGLGSGDSGTASLGSADGGSMNPEFDASQGAGVAASPSWLAQNGEGALAAAGGAYNAYSGTVDAFKTGNPLTGAVADAAEGAAIGSIVPGVGTLVGAAAGAAIGAGAGLAGLVTGMSGNLSARDYYNKQVFPTLNDLAAHPNGDFQTEIAQANLTANTALQYMGAHFGMNAANWVNDNYMKKEVQKVVTLIADTAKGGRQFTTMSAAQFHSGGRITGFGDFATSGNEGMIHAMLDETVMNPAASREHGSILAAMNGGASAAEIASKYLAGSAPMGGGSSSGGGDTHFHVHTLDTRTMSGWLKNGGAQMIKKHQNDYSAQYAGDGING